MNTVENKSANTGADKSANAGANKNENKSANAGADKAANANAGKGADKGRKSVRRFLIMLLAVFLCAVLGSAFLANRLEQQKLRKQESESATSGLDKYSMQQYCRQNAEDVFKALKRNSKKQLEKVMIDPEGVDSVIAFADWRNADFDNIVSMGSGSLTTAPDKNGRMDESERFFVDVDGTRYVLFIETVTSGMGRNNDGVSAIGVTTYEHFDADDYDWNGEASDYSALAGELFWKSE